MTKGQKAEQIKIISRMKYDTLMNNYNKYRDNFSPNDYDKCETFKLLEAEVLLRLMAFDTTR